MKETEYLEKRKELVSGQVRGRSRMYPVLMGIFAFMIVLNVAMLAINSL